MTSGEFAHIDWIRQRVKSQAALPVGIGDDAAMLRLSGDTDCLLAADMLMEGVHFTFPELTPADVGRKALAVNLSDIAAMAGRPKAALVSIALPRNACPNLPRELHDGLQQLADEFGVSVAGGDTNSWDGPLVINVTIIGEPTDRGPVLRNGAKVGDGIFVTGSLGGSLAGNHFSFQPRVREALELHQSVDLHAMIDISDGLAADLHHILNESDVGAELIADDIPINSAAQTADGGHSPLRHALTDGEDFELLFTVSPADGEKLLRDSRMNVPLTRIGTISADRECILVDADGSRTELPAGGWTHKF